jgi:uncharacterized membrane protein YkvA (DUF1232 family)
MSLVCPRPARRLAAVPDALPILGTVDSLPLLTLFLHQLVHRHHKYEQLLSMF